MKRTALSVLFVLSACGAAQNDADLQSQLSAILKDPSSVQYQKVTQNAQVICGELNAKNSYGAYTGFKAFIFERGKKKLWLEDSGDASDHYDQFLDAMDRCENHVDLLTAKVARTSRSLNEQLRDLERN